MSANLARRARALPQPVQGSLARAGPCEYAAFAPPFNPGNALGARLARVCDVSMDDQQMLSVLCADTRHFERHCNLSGALRKPDRVPVLMDGWAARFRILADGSRQITALLLPGDVCDVEALYGRRGECELVALTPLTIARMPRRRVVELLAEPSELARALWWTMLAGEARLQEALVNIGRRNAVSRIAHLLCELAFRLADCNCFDLPITQADLGDALGLSGIHVNRTLQRLRAECFIALKGGKLTVLDSERLHRLAGFDPGYLCFQPVRGHGRDD